MKDKIKKILKIIVNILTFIIFAILIIVIIAKVKMMVTNNDYFDVFGYSVFEVTTGSMEPTIKQNDIIVVKTQSDYKIDDIITYKNNNAYVTHRIISENGTIYVTKGDANNTSDEAITKDTILGKVIHIYSNLGIWQKILTTPKIIVLVFITLILFDFAFSYKPNNKEKISKKINKEKNEVNDEEIKQIKKDLEKDNEELDYTVRLDLSKVQKEIEEKIKKNEK